jgi:hypothetical protein
MKGNCFIDIGGIYDYYGVSVSTVDSVLNSTWVVL